ncbi:MAG: methionine--tRNA ligase [Candidatus Aminicenantes bacterium]|nr:methionine--tRNA ligase [Candidatus Aminicenantes bacterium]
MAKKSKPPFYVTTPIYYVNDVPHIGHAYTTIIADTLARFMKMNGRDVFFLTGTDEHGQKVEKAATAHGVDPRAWADKVVVRFFDLWKALDCEPDFFIRTTMDIHEKGVQKLFKILLDRGDIYKGEYKGWYCVSDENFLTEDVALDKDGTKTCPDCGRKAQVVSEETYFFRLSAYQQKLLDHYRTHPQFVRPQSRMNEVTSFVRGGLKDLSITRTTVKWGVPVPGDPAHTIYVWFDALHNYVTGIGYDRDPALFEKFWPASVHLIGKDILRFHAVFWPAFLMASRLPLPECVFGHGWWMKDEAKMSKSKGNVLDPYVLIRAMGPDPLRYFLLREVPIGLDGNFSHEGFIHRVNSDLANDLGNLVSRALTMIRNYFQGKIPPPAAENPADAEIRKAFEEMKKWAVAQYDSYALNKALEEIWAFITTVNKYLADNAPWKLHKDPALRPRLARVLYQAAASLRGVAALIAPVMPGSAQKMWEFLGESGSVQDVRFDDLAFAGLDIGHILKEPTPLFPRVDLKAFLAEEPGTSKEQPMDEPKTPSVDQNIITYDEFAKLELRVAHVLEAVKVEGAKKLLKLKIDLGTEQRQIVAGVAETYAPEQLVGKKFIVIVNLKPAVIRGVESQGMLLAAVSGDKSAIPFFEADVPTGAKVK